MWYGESAQSGIRCTQNSSRQRNSQVGPEKMNLKEPLARVNPTVRWGLLAFLLCASVYLLRLDEVAGMFVDDGWYILLGKALATGQGYTLINSPSAGIMPVYPPAFPALLSLIFRIYPSFPANVWLLKLPSILGLLLSGALAYYYLVRIHELNRGLAFGITVLTLLTPALVFLATSTVMSEIFFMLIQTAVFVIVERSLRVAAKGAGGLLVITAAGLASVAFLTRSIGVGLLVAAGIYYLLNRRVLYAVAFSFVVCLMVGPWLLYARHDALTAAQVFEQKGYITQSYSASFWQKLAGAPESGTISYRQLPRRVAGNMSEVCIRDIGGLTLPALYRSSAESGMETFGMTGDMGMATDVKIVSAVVSAFSVLGFFIVVRRKLRLSELTLLCTLPVILTWPWLPFRFLVPFTPFIFLYLVSGMEGAWSASLRLLKVGASSGRSGPRNALPVPVRIFLQCAILLNLYDHGNFLLGKFHLVGSPPVMVESFSDGEMLMGWMRANLEPSAVIATENPPLVHLYTGLKTVSTSDTKEELVRRKVNYVAHVSPFFAPPFSDADTKKQILFETSRYHFFVLQLGP